MLIQRTVAHAESLDTISIAGAVLHFIVKMVQKANMLQGDLEEDAQKYIPLAWDSMIGEDTTDQFQEKDNQT